MASNKNGECGGTKPSNEQREASEDSKYFNSVLKDKGINVEDPKHPLRGLPDDRLQTAIRWALNDDSGKKKFLETYARMVGVGFSRQALNGWLRESSKINADRLGFIVDMLARFMADEMTGRLSGEIVGEILRRNPFAPLDLPTSHERYEAAYSLIVDCLFGLARPDRIKLKRFAVIAALMETEEAELDAVGAVLTCRIQSGSGWGKRTAREALEDVRRIGPNESMTEVAEGPASDLFEARALENIGELLDWAAEVREFAEERQKSKQSEYTFLPFL
ncbi:hypothetical protein [Collinsella vaginalis]|uniref:hypothetical protein n=1 Tax=Collinsella vaginalis TaxID=1870987 RepID=UPI000A26FFAA|nr:hypothetical protein [Collinsella vaginalis]